MLKNNLNGHKIYSCKIYTIRHYNTLYVSSSLYGENDVATESVFKLKNLHPCWHVVVTFYFIVLYSWSLKCALCRVFQWRSSLLQWDRLCLVCWHTLSFLCLCFLWLWYSHAGLTTSAKLRTATSTLTRFDVILFISFYLFIFKNVPIIV